MTSLVPDSTAMTGAAGFVRALRALKLQAGDPSLTDLSRRCGVPRSTLSDALATDRRRMPRLEVALALISACGVAEPDIGAWADAWKRARQAEDGPSGPAADSTGSGRSADQPAIGNLLPRDVADFSGRRREVGRLLGLAASAEEGSAVVVCAIDGMAGVGKTALALHAAHRVSACFPDGQLFLDLHAHTPGGDPTDPMAALEQLLREVGAAAGPLPDRLAERAARWRARTAERRLLIVLDNAVSADQISPLLPGTAGSLVLVTSRNRLPGLVGAEAVSLDVLPADEAATLFGRVLGERADAEPDAVTDVVELCGRLPLAIRIAAARLRHRPAHSVTNLADRLRDKRRKLAELSTAELGVGAAFALSYQQLPADQQLMFRRLGLHPGPEVESMAAAALCGTDAVEAERMLDGLLEAHLLEERTADRFSLHDLTREYARSVVESGDTREERAAAVDDLLDYYLWSTGLVADLLVPNRRAVVSALGHPPRAAPELSGAGAARAWAGAEREALVAVVRLAAEYGRDAHCWQLARNLAQYLMFGCHIADNIAVQETALAAAERLGDRHAELICAGNLSMPYWQGGDYPRAVKHARHAVTLARTLEDRATEGACLNRVGILHDALGEYRLAVDDFTRALDVLHATGSTAPQSNVAVNLGRTLITLGQYGEAAQVLRRAADLARGHADRRNEGDALVLLALTDARLERPTAALAQIDQALPIALEAGGPSSHVIALTVKAQILRALGSRDAAVMEVRHALDILHEIDYPSLTAAAHNLLGALHQDVGRFHEALDEHRLALNLAERIGDRRERAAAMRGQSIALASLGRLEIAHQIDTEARRLYAELGLPATEELLPASGSATD